jgi:hypothetical protein
VFANGHVRETKKLFGAYLQVAHICYFFLFFAIQFQLLERTTQMEQNLSVGERIQTAGFIATSQMVDLIPVVPTAKEELLKDFLRGGIDQDAVGEFLTACESVLHRESTKHWLVNFVKGRHESIATDHPEALNDAEKYFAALGFKDFPPVDPFVAKRDTFLDLALQRVTESLLVVACPLGAGLPPNEWHMVSVTVHSHKGLVVPKDIAIYVTNEPNNIEDKGVKKQLIGLQRLLDNAEFWYHGTSLKNATSIAENGIHQLARGQYTDFSRESSFYLNSYLHGESGAINWCFTKYMGRQCSTAVLIYAIQPDTWRINHAVLDDNVGPGWKNSVTYSHTRQTFGTKLLSVSKSPGAAKPF